MADYVTFAVTAFEEMSDRRGNGKHLLECLESPQRHPRVGEIVVVDDGSNDFDQLAHFLNDREIALYHNKENLGVFGNKLEIVAKARHEWVITCDSDNVMGASYIDKVLSQIGDTNTWYYASFARPRFDYRDLVGVYDLQNLEDIINHQRFPCFFNTGNHTVHRDEFLKVFGKYRGRRADLMMPNWLNLPEPVRPDHYWRMTFDALDSFILNYYWVMAGNKIKIVEGLEYDHRFAIGDTGNYTRSPSEKVDLGNILLRELKEAVCQTT